MTRLTTLIATTGIVVATIAPASGAARAPDRVRADVPTCHGLAATIVGTDGNDVIHGTDGPDVIVAGAGDDVVDGGGRGDRICGGDGDDRLSGGRDQDIVDGEAGSDFVTGDQGYDSLYGGSGADRVDDTHPRGDDFFGGSGNDLLRGCGGMHADPGNDRIVGTCRSGSSLFFDDATNATPVDVDLRRGTADNAVTGHDTLVGIRAVRGTPANDRIAGDSEANQLLGEGGNDVLIGRGGGDALVDDQVCGTDCTDAILDAPLGADVLRGGRGDDAFFMKGGSDTVRGGRGRDAFLPDRVMSQHHKTTAIVIDLARGFFRWDGHDGTVLKVEDANGTLFADDIRGSRAKNRIDGSGGADVIYGRAGNDRLRGGAGTDVVHGGSGTDYCVFAEVRFSCEGYR